MKSYVIMYQSGEFDDYSQAPVRVTDNKIKADMLANQLNTYVKDWENKIEAASSGKWYFTYKKENPEPEYWGNQLYYEFRSQLNYIISCEKSVGSVLDYKEAYELYDAYNFGNTGFRKYKKKKPTYDDFIDEAQKARNKYFQEMDKAREQHIEKILTEFPDHLHEILRECDGYKMRFKIVEVEKI